MVPILMAAIGLFAGFALDALIARLASEPFERASFDEGEADAAPAPAALALGLGSEAGALRMPTPLTSGADTRRLIVVTLTALLFAGVGFRYQDYPWQLFIVTGYAAALIVCTGTDFIAHRIPNIVTYPAIAAALVAGMLAPDIDRLYVVGGGAVWAGPLLVMWVVTRGAMGLGDVKLALFTGLAMGLRFAAYGILLMALAGGIVALALLIGRKRGRRDGIPYGPYIAIGAIAVMLMDGTAIQQL